MRLFYFVFLLCLRGSTASFVEGELYCWPPCLMGECVEAKESDFLPSYPELPLTQPANIQRGKCECYDRHFGVDCRFSGWDPCLAEPCQNGGICDSGDGTPPVCYCPEAYTGKQCQHPRCNVQDLVTCYNESGLVHGFQGAHVKAVFNYTSLSTNESTEVCDYYATAMSCLESSGCINDQLVAGPLRQSCAGANQAFGCEALNGLDCEPPNFITLTCQNFHKSWYNVTAVCATEYNGCAATYGAYGTVVCGCYRNYIKCIQEDLDCWNPTIEEMCSETLKVFKDCKDVCVPIQKSVDEWEAVLGKWTEEDPPSEDEAPSADNASSRNATDSQNETLP